MRQSFYLTLLLLLPATVLAQQYNYVVNTPNSTVPGDGSTLVGPYAGYSSIAGSKNNTMLGHSAGYTNTTGKYNTMLGVSTGFFNTTGEHNTFVGSNAGRYNTTSVGNTCIGSSAGLFTTTGEYNVFIGVSAGQENRVGVGNMFLGAQAGFNSKGSYNLFMGSGTGASTTTGGDNTAVGTSALLYNLTGSRNTAIGEYAGQQSTNDENVFIGYSADVAPASPNLTNVTVIGARAQASQSNSVILGNNANVGIGTSAPAAKLEVVSSTSGGLRLSSLGTTATVLNQTKFLTVDPNGNVVLGSLNESARIGVEAESLWQRKGAFLESSQGQAVIIGQGVSKTPSDYNLFVSKGILTEKVKVAIKNTSDWSDKVFEGGYKLKSLGEVERHIQQTGHLPGVPSAVEVVEQGIDVAKMDAKLLEKVEELTLYSIQLEKVNQQQAQELQAIKAKQAQLEQLVNTLINAKQK